MAPRVVAWGRLARDLDRELLAQMTQTVSFSKVFETGEAILKGQVRGRVVVEID